MRDRVPPCRGMAIAPNREQSCGRCYATRSDPKRMASDARRHPRRGCRDEYRVFEAGQQHIVAEQSGLDEQHGAACTAASGGCDARQRRRDAGRHGGRRIRAAGRRGTAVVGFERRLATAGGDERRALREGLSGVRSVRDRRRSRHAAHTPTSMGGVAALACPAVAKKFQSLVERERRCRAACPCRPRPRVFR